MPRRFPIGYSADARILLASYFSGEPATIKEILLNSQSAGGSRREESNTPSTDYDSVALTLSYTGEFIAF